MFMTLKHQFACLALSVAGIAIGPSYSAKASTIEAGQTGVLVPVVGGGSGSIGFGLKLDISNPLGSIEIRHHASDNSLLATELLSFDSSGNGAYHLDLSYRSVNGLVDIEPLFPGLDLVGQLGGDPTNSEPWVSEHTELNSGKIIWSFADGTVITIDPNAGQAEVQTTNFQGLVSAPLPLLELPASLAITNLTPETIKASNLIPEPASVVLMLIAGTFAIVTARRR